MFVGGGLTVSCVCVEETGRVNNYLGECSLNSTRPDGECSEILVANPDTAFKLETVDVHFTELLASALSLTTKQTALYQSALHRLPQCVGP